MCLLDLENRLRRRRRGGDKEVGQNFSRSIKIIEIY